MRTRLTVVGFNLTIVAIQLSQLPRFPGGIHVPDLNFTLNVEAGVALLVAMGCSILAAVTFVGAAAFDRAGDVDNRWLVAGDLLMCLGLAHCMHGFFGPMAHLLDKVPVTTVDEAAGLTTVRVAIVVVGGAAWLSAAYVAPVVSLLRARLTGSVTAVLAIAYLIALVLLAHVSAEAAGLQASGRAAEAGSVPSILSELFKPLRW